MPDTAVKDDARTGARQQPRGAVASDRVPTPPHPGADEPIRVPRLLVAGSELGWRFLVCVAALAVIVFAITKVSFAFIPAFIALLFATLLTPPARWLQRRGAPPALATTTVFLGGLLAFAGVIALLVPPMVSEFSTLGEQVRKGVDQLVGYLGHAPFNLDEERLQRQIDGLDDRLQRNAGSMSSGFLSGAMAAGQFLGGVVIMLVLLFFFVKDGPRLWRWVLRLFPEPRRPVVDEVGERSWHVLTQYVRGVVIVAAVDAIGIGIALWLIGVPLALPLAIFTFFASFIPIVGAFTAGLFATLVALVSGGPVDAALVIAATLLVQQLEGNVLYPMIVGRTLELHPIVILLAVTIGGVLAGIVGAALAVPIAAMAAAAIVTVRRNTPGGEVAVEARTEC
jgi:predicted PurR-regulated permease PerM